MTRQIVIVSLLKVLLLAGYHANLVQAFTSVPGSRTQINLNNSLLKNSRLSNDSQDADDVESIPMRKKNVHPHEQKVSRRSAMKAASTLAVLSLSAPDADALNLNPFVPLDQISNGGKYQPAKRATAYLVDSTIPPTLVPFRASREAAILKKIGSGAGTQKTPFTEEKLNLNNMMNKGVFGTIDLVKGVVGDGDVAEGEDDKKKKAYDASFVFMGVDYFDNTNADTDLAIGLMTDIFKPRRGLNSALALGFIPISMQSTLDSYVSGNLSEAEMVQTLVQDSKVPEEIMNNQLSILKFAKSKQVSLIASAPEMIDIQTARTEGLQNVDAERRANYVADSEGFIAWTQDPKWRMYTEKSLLKDFIPFDEKDSPGNYFAQKILEHETMATAIAKYAMRNPKSLIVGVAQIKDLRFLGGPNGRLSRVCKVIKSNTNVDDEAITTILLNPTADKTLSKSKFLRLEIGTAPKLLQYQTKVADYLWFSSMPKVNMIPRMMNGTF